jgi:DNA adenine methylase
MSEIAKPVLRYHGGKFRLADWIVGHFPAHQVYVEPFGGAASVLMRKPRSFGEVYNDLDGEIVNVMRVLQNDYLRARLERAVVFTPYARQEFDLAWEPTDDPVERARRTFIRSEMGFGSGGATKGSTGFRIDAKRGYATAAHVWAGIPEHLRSFGLRLQGVLIENRPALQVMFQHDSPDTLFYIDPPYIHSTRKMRDAVYRHEMTDGDHVDLLDAVLELKGMAIISGYDHPLYVDRLKGWRRAEKNARVSAGRGTRLAMEMIWISPNVAASGFDFGEAAA